MKNRGKADAHELKWRIITDGGETILDGDLADVIPAEGHKALTDRQNAIISALPTKMEAVVICDYVTSWGERLTLKRNYLNGKSQGILLLDADGNALTIRTSTD